MNFENFKEIKLDDIQLLTYLFTRFINQEEVDYGMTKPVNKEAKFIGELSSKFIVNNLEKRGTKLYCEDMIEFDIFSMIGKVLFLIKEEKIGVNSKTKEKHLDALKKLIEDSYRFEYDDKNDVYFIAEKQSSNP